MEDINLEEIRKQLVEHETVNKTEIPLLDNYIEYQYEFSGVDRFMVYEKDLRTARVKCLEWMVFRLEEMQCRMSMMMDAMNVGNLAAISQVTVFDYTAYERQSDDQLDREWQGQS